jgi:hypothetical protein
MLVNINIVNWYVKRGGNPSNAIILFPAVNKNSFSDMHKSKVSR